MSKSALMIKTDSGSWTPATDKDSQELSSLNPGSGYRFNLIRQSNRSVQWHRLYWSGLIKLGMQYWQPAGGFITQQEEQLIERFASYLGMNQTQEGRDAIHNAAHQFLLSVANRRSESCTPLEPTPQSFHEWVKEQVGLYDLIRTPSGIKKQTKSINFNSMSAEEWNEYYKSAFNVIWNLVLSQYFETEKAAEDAINQLLVMGG